MHDPRIGRFFAVDPLSALYPHNSPYAFSENVVVNAVELEGLEKKTVINYYETALDESLVVVKTEVSIDQDYNFIKDDIMYATTNEEIWVDGNYIKTSSFNEVVYQNGMEPSSGYDYTQEPIDGKFTSDWSYILSGQSTGGGSSNGISRSGEIGRRDSRAPDNKGTIQDLEVLEATSIPIIGKGVTRRGVSSANALSKEILESANDLNVARNRAQDLTGLGTGSSYYRGTMKHNKDQIVGLSGKDDVGNVVRYRYDIDEKGAFHINVEDFRTGKGDKATKYRIDIPGGKDAYDKKVKELNK